MHRYPLLLAWGPLFIMDAVGKEILQSMTVKYFTTMTYPSNAGSTCYAYLGSS